MCYCCKAQLIIVNPSKKENTFNFLDDAFVIKYVKKKDNLFFELRIAEDMAFSQNLKLFKFKGNPGENTLKITIPYFEAGKSYYWDIRALYTKKNSEVEEKDEWYSVEKNKNQPLIVKINKNAKDRSISFDEGMKEEVNRTGNVESIKPIANLLDANEYMPVISKDKNALAYVSDKGGALEIYSFDDINESSQTLVVKSRNGRSMLNPFWFNNGQIGFYSDYLESKNFNLFRNQKGNAVRQIIKWDKAKNENLYPKMLYATSDTIQFNEETEIGKEALVIYTHQNESEKPNLMLYNGYNDKDKELTSGMMPDLSNRLIVYCDEYSNNMDIWMVELKVKGMNVFVGSPTQLTSNSAKDYEPAWSPDMKRIAFVSQREGNADIFILDLDQGEDQLFQLTYNPMCDRKPQWINNYTIVFQTNRNLDENGNPQWDIYSITLPEY